MIFDFLLFLNGLMRYIIYNIIFTLKKKILKLLDLLFSRNFLFPIKLSFFPVKLASFLCVQYY